MHLLQWRRKSKNIMLINRPRKQKERQIELNKSCNQGSPCVPSFYTVSQLGELRNLPITAPHMQNGEL